jgi:acyl-CoA synthetase (AMP-forming)/AMP-acid ligase II/alkylation response protein AidB-like acyl-CoA dehydrogenase/acyl carrier protein
MTSILQSSPPVRVDVPANLVDMLRGRADLHPDGRACLYLGDGEGVRDELSFGELDRRARALAARLQALSAGGECAVLVYPPGLEFFPAFFGCLYANVIAVPLPIPRANASIAQFAHIIGEIKARVLLTTATTMPRIGRADHPLLNSLICLTTEETPLELAAAWRPATAAEDATAYLQYTSGSTAARKGVIVAHRHVLANLRAIGERFRHEEGAVCVNWLPHIHDLGLVSGMLQPLYHGHPNVLMSPNAFVQKPIRWLDAISEYRGTYTNSPNFGYDLCVRRTTAEQRARLDLSSWRVALNGAEPVRDQTIVEFAAMFAPHGFRRETMYPAYGLAEATLVVSGGRRDELPVTLALDASALEQGRVVEASAGTGSRVMVGCGSALELTTITIVDADARKPCAEGEIGEIWVHGPGVAGGYWQRTEDTVETFQASLPNDPTRTFLRTGDLGFLRNGELFITGRLKDLIIVRGNNHYPQDIEFTIEQCHTAFRPGCGAAFSVEGDDTERLVVAFELERDHLRTVDGAELERLARRAVAEQHDLHLHALLLLRTGTVPRTSSGKIQRRQCRADFLANTLAVVWRSPDVPAPAMASTSGEAVSRTEPASADGLCEWLREYADTSLNSRLMDERRSIAPHVMLDFGNHGVMGLLVPEEYGGLALGYRDAMQVFQQLGAIDQTLAMMAIVHNVLGIGPILQHGSDTLKTTWLPRLASGRELVAFAMTEPSAGSNPLAIATRATPCDEGGWRLSGEKSWSGSAGWAGVINVFAQTVGADAQPHGISGFAVSRRTPGLRVGPEALTLGMRGMVQNTVYLDEARVTRDHCLGEPGEGMKVAQQAMMRGRLAIGAACVGGMKRCLQLLVRYAERRTIATGRLLDNPMLRDRAGAWSAAVHGLESLVGHIASRLDAGGDVPQDAYVVCKIAGAEWFWRAADDLVQFLGGRGYMETNVAAQLLRDARVTRILEGPTEALVMFLGSRAVNDSSGLRVLMAESLGAPRLAARFIDAARTIESACVEGARYEGTDARRWAYALIGQLASDAVLCAAASRSATPHVAAWAEAHFEASATAAIAAARRAKLPASGDELAGLARDFAGAIGDIEQSLAGEEQALDSMLQRDPRKDAVPVANRPLEAAPPITLEPEAAAPRRVDRVTLREAADAEAVGRFIVRWIAKELKLPEASIDAKRSVFDYGLDSVTVVMLTASLEEWLGIDLSPETVYDLPVIDRFASYVSRRQADKMR